MSDLETRLDELEQRQTRFKLATTGDDGWNNWLEARLLQERDFNQTVLGQIIADPRREFLETAKGIIDKALTQRVRGTFNAKTSYGALDIVACDGASFLARRDNPGPCPGEGWQLIAKQGQRGVAGEKGEPGRDAPHIVKWQLDQATYTAIPVLSDGRMGAQLELRPLFQQFLTETKL
jgi:hypothetical protein